MIEFAGSIEILLAGKYAVFYQYTDLYMILSICSILVVDAPQAKCPREISSVEVILLASPPLFKVSHRSNPAESCNCGV